MTRARDLANSADLSFDGSTFKIDTANDRVGIGTDSPSQKLHVSSADHTRVLITGGTDKYAELQFENDAQKFAMGVQNDDKFFLYNSTGTTQVLTVDTSSNIGINTQSPGSRKLKIVGSSSAYPLALDSTDTDYQLEFQKNGVSEWWIVASASSFKIHENGVGDHLTVLANGNVGIGTNNPGANLDIEDSTGATLFMDDTNGRSLNFRTANNSTQNSNISSYAGLYLGGSDNANHVVIESGGDVGIGTGSPAGKLHIQSGDAGAVTPSSQADDLVVEASTEVGITLMSPDNESARIRFTSPSTESGDEGGADIFYRQNINKMIMGTVVSGGKLAFKSGAGVETMVLNGGNVGIGTDNPGKKLAVNGTGSFVAGFNNTGLTITGGTTLQNAGKIRLEGAGTGCDHIQIVNDGNSFIVGVERSVGTAIMGGTYAYGSVIGSVTNNPLHFGVNNTAKMTLETDGSVFFPERSTYGDMTFPICSVSNAGSSNRYLHVQFQGTGGDMLHIKFTGYEYIGSAIKEGVGGGYIYNTGGQNQIYARAQSGDCVEVWQNTSNRVELVIDTGTSQVGNRWGSYVFYGGTDTITANSPLKLVQYTWTSSTAKVYY